MATLPALMPRGVRPLAAALAKRPGALARRPRGHHQLCMAQGSGLEGGPYVAPIGELTRSLPRPRKSDLEWAPLRSSPTWCGPLSGQITLGRAREVATGGSKPLGDDSHGNDVRHAAMVRPHCYAKTDAPSTPTHTGRFEPDAHSGGRSPMFRHTTCGCNRGEL